MEHLSEHWGSQLRIEALVYDIPKGAYLIKTLSSLTRCKTASPIILQRNNPGSSSHTYVGLSSSSHGSSALLARIASHLTHPPPAIFIRIYQGWPLDLQEGPLPVHQANPGIPHLSPGHWLGQTAPSREPGHWSPLINLGFGRLVSDFQGEPGVSLCPPSTLPSWGTPLRSWPWIFPRHWSPRIDFRPGHWYPQDTEGSNRGRPGGPPPLPTKTWIEGWLSMDRSEWAALPRTKPWPRIRSSTSHLAPGSPQTLGALQEMGGARSSAPRSSNVWLSAPSAPGGRPAIPGQSKSRGAAVSSHSDLEAFSHNPADGSFAPVAPQPSTRTKCLNLRFLSYWAGLLLQWQHISRVKLTCLTTV